MNDCPHRAAEEQLIHFSGFNGTVCETPAADYGRALGPECPLLARKFGPDVADAVTHVVRTSKVLRDIELAQWG